MCFTVDCEIFLSIAIASINNEINIMSTSYIKLCALDNLLNNEFMQLGHIQWKTLYINMQLQNMI